MKDRLGDYSQLPNCDHDDSRTASQPTRPHRLTRSLGIAAFLALALVTGLIASSTHGYLSLRHSNPKITYCGHTSSEARALGCVLEPMMYGWMPPQCQYPEVTSHNNFTKWPWYADENMTQLLNEEQIWKGEFISLWTNISGYHTEHCLFLYRKLMYGLENKVRWLDKKTVSSSHAYHCVGQLSEAPEGPNDTTFVQLGIYTCEETTWY